MALREKLRDRVQPLLDPAEQVDSVFLAQTGPNPNLRFLTSLVVFWTKNDVVAVTDRRIAVFRASRWRPARPRRLIDVYPRSASLRDSWGPVWGSLELGGTKYWIHRRFRADVRKANEV